MMDLHQRSRKAIILCTEACGKSFTKGSNLKHSCKVLSQVTRSEIEDDQTAQQVVHTAAQNALVHRIITPRKPNLKHSCYWIFKMCRWVHYRRFSTSLCLTSPHFHKANEHINIPILILLQME